jgi:UPF0755 protein
MRATVKIAAVLAALVVLAAAGAYLLASQRIDAPFQGFSSSEQFVDIAPGTGTAAIGRSLVEAGVIRDEATFRLALWLTGQSRGLQAGEYRFDGPITPRDVVNRLARGDVYTRRLTFPEGLTIAEMAEIYQARGFGTAPAFSKAAQDTSAIRDLDPAATDLEGYLFPETYPVPRGMPAERVVRMMVDRFRAVYSGDLQASAKEQGFTTRQVMALASLVEKETGKPDERPMVAAVYRNRLRIGMGLQADPTVVYALRQAGRYNGNIRREDLQIDSPYNTYRYAGLPPGPIAAPGRASIEAALQPAPVPYLYFVSRNDGSHVFAETLAEHNRNVREYQVLYFRRQNGR